MRILSRIFALLLCVLLLTVFSGSDEAAGRIVSKSIIIGRCHEVESDEEELARIYFEEVDKEVSATLDAILFEAKTEGYAEAIVALQNLIEQRGDSLIPVKDSESRFVNFAGQIFEKINSSPAILSAYRRRFDPKVRKLLNEARQKHDISLLVKIWRDYRPSSHTGEALYELGTLALEQGDWGRAAWCLKRAAVYESVPRGLCLVKQASALAEMGDEAGIRAILRDLPGETASEKIRMVRSVVSVEECLKTLLEKIRHEKIAIPDVPLEAVTSSTEIPEVKRPKRSQRDKYEMYLYEDMPHREKSRRSYANTPYHAQYADGKICVVHESGLRVFDGDGKFLWDSTTLFSYARKRQSRPSYWYRYPYMQAIQPVYQEFPVIWGGRVFTVVPAWFEVPIGDRGCYKVSPRKLICMDLKSGKIKWMTGGCDADDYRPLHLISFCTPPLCLSGKAYAVGYNPHPQKKSNRYSLYCMDCMTGRVLWEAPLYQNECIIEEGVFDTRLRGRALMPSTDGTRIFVATDDGASLCVNTIDGRIDWATKYPVKRLMDEYSRYEEDYNKTYWSGMRSVYADGILLVTAADSRWLFAHDADSGEVLWKWDNKARTVDYIFGVRDSKVILCGEYLAMFDLKTGRPIKKMRVPYPPNSFICGRICASDTCLYWPTKQGIMVYDLRNFKLRAAFSFKTMKAARNVGDMGEAKEEYSGNLILVGDKLVSVSDKRITFYGPAPAEPETPPEPATPPAPDDEKGEDGDRHKDKPAQPEQGERKEENGEPDGPPPTEETPAPPETAPDQR